MADNCEGEFSSFQSVYSNFAQNEVSHDEETENPETYEEMEEPKQNDDSENIDQREPIVVESPVLSSMAETESLTLEDLATSDFIRNRQLAAKSIVECLRKAESNKEALHAVISVMCKLSEDEDIMVRSELIEQIPSIAIFCKERSEDLGVVIRQQIVPYTVKLLTDIQKQVRKIGHTTLLVLLENDVIDHSQLSEWICPLISQLATSDNTPEDLRLEDVSVMCRMIPYVGKEITEKFFLEPFLALCRDESQWLKGPRLLRDPSSAKEVCMLNFGSICQVIGREAAETTLLSAFLDFCQDESCDIKSKCVNIAVDLASVVSPTTRNEILSHVYMNFLKHESQSVRFSAQRSLGRFISTFADPSKTGLSYSDGTWFDTPVEDNNSSEDSNSENYFEQLTSEIISNPQFLDECSFKNLNCLLDNYSNDEVFPTLQPSKMDSKVFFARTSFRSRKEKFEKRNFDYSKYGYVFRSSNYQWPQALSNSDCAFSDNISDEHFNANSEQSHLQNSLNCEKKSLNNTHDKKKSRHFYLHVDNENNFNNFQYWRTPLPDVELDIEDCKSTNVNLKTELHEGEDAPQSCTSESSITISSKESTKEPDNKLQKVNTEEELNSLDLRFKAIVDNKTKNRLLLLDENEGSTVRRKGTKPIDKEKNIYDRLLLSDEKQVTKEESKPIDIESNIYNQDIVPVDLLLEFINMSNDTDLMINLAYYFPSVAYTLGRKNWPCIRDLFDLLATDGKFNVRRKVASSLHELAVILGQDITTKDLLPVFLDLLRDRSVISAVLPNISDFLKRLKPLARRQFLPLIEEICEWDEDDSNWRYRLTVAEQFIPCVQLFSSSEALHFLPVSLLLMQDKVSTVRKCAVELLAVIIKSMGTNSKSANFLKAALCALDEKYRKASKWLWRQMYVYICQELAVLRSLSTEFYVNEIVPNLFTLAWDTVPNVRLAVARCLALTLLPLDFWPSIQKTHYQLLLQVMYSLQSDVDKDVRHFALLSAGAFNVLPPKKESHGAQFNKCQEWWENSD